MPEQAIRAQSLSASFGLARAPSKRGPDNREVSHAETQMVYTLPIGKGKRFGDRGGLFDTFFGGWDMGSVVTWHRRALQHLLAASYLGSDHGRLDQLQRADEHRLSPAAGQRRLLFPPGTGGGADGTFRFPRRR